MGLHIRQGMVWWLVSGISAGAAVHPGPVGTLVEADGLVASSQPGWPQWRGPRRDAISEETGLLQTWPDEGPPEAWSVDGLGIGWSSPVVSGGTVVVTGDIGESLVLFAFDRDGAPRWQATNGRSWTRSWPGARSCPVMAGDHLYHLNAHGRLAAYTIEEGRETWACNVLERFGAPNITWALAENILVCGSVLYVTVGGPQALVVALTRETGEVLWASEPIPGDKTSYASPILFRHAGRTILANCSSGHGFGIDASTGEMLWARPMPNTYGAVVSTPVFGGGDIFYAAPDGADASLYRIVDGPEEVGTTLMWTNAVDVLTGSGVRVGDRLFAAGCKNSKTLHCIDWETGAIRYSWERQLDKTPRWAAVACLWADHRLYAVADDGFVALLEPAEDRFVTHGRFRLVEAERQDLWAHPVLGDRRLYLRYRDRLWCFDLSAPAR